MQPLPARDTQPRRFGSSIVAEDIKSRATITSDAQPVAYVSKPGDIAKPATYSRPEK